MGHHKELSYAIESQLKVLETERKVLQREHIALMQLQEFVDAEVNSLSVSTTELTALQQEHEDAFGELISQHERVCQSLRTILYHKKTTDKARKDFEVAEKKLTKARNKLGANNKPEKQAVLETEVQTALNYRDEVKDTYDHAAAACSQLTSGTVKEAFVIYHVARAAFFHKAAGLADQSAAIADAMDAEVSSTFAASATLDDLEPGAQTGEAGSAMFQAKAMFDYEAQEDNELTFYEDDIIDITVTFQDGWWKGSIKGSEEGLVPSSYLEQI
eukprot:TRINITY_DN10177_c0_g1_i1.p1 TRINITY_DN10177_c0_g1~~TRINITY_DN10177_c0_g1_i1.p1  ORF type:complete len:297 (-),score=76.93 TRINITY_DN10177_c0_g1_i1:12-830(-)